MIGLEFIQKYLGGHGTLIGTFDKFDIIFFTLGYITIVFISYFIHIRGEKQTKENSLITKKSEIIENLRYIIIFIVLGTLPSLF